MKMKLLALAIGVFAVGISAAASYAANKRCVPVRCTIDPVTKQKRCTLQCSDGSLILN